MTDSAYRELLGYLFEHFDMIQQWGVPLPWALEHPSRSSPRYEVALRLLSMAADSRSRLELLLGRGASIRYGSLSAHSCFGLFSLSDNASDTPELMRRILHSPGADAWVVALMLSHELASEADRNELLPDIARCGYYVGAAWLLLDRDREDDRDAYQYGRNDWVARTAGLFSATTDLTQFPRPADASLATTTTTQLARTWTGSVRQLNETVHGILAPV